MSRWSFLHLLSFRQLSGSPALFSPAVIGAMLLLGGCASSDPGGAFAGVRGAVSERAGHAVDLRWSRDPAADAETQRAVERLLRRGPLTAQTAAQVAVLNNRSLQAEFEEIGIAHADYIQAGLLSNPEFSTSFRFPNRPPSVVDAEYALAANVLDLFLLPARRKIAAGELERTKLRVAAEVLGLIAETKVDRDFALMLHEWRQDPGTSRPDPNEMVEFNLLTINGKAYPGTAPLVVKKGDRVRIRIGNLSPMDHHPIHLHGYQFVITETDGGRIPKSAQHPDTTVLVPVGSTRTVEFVADEPGDWAMHCHMTHHVMNQMGHGFPNMIGVRPGKLDEHVRKNLRLPGYMTMGETGMADMGAMGMKVPPNSIPMVGGEGPLDYITMGGMFTILKVRDELPNGYDADPGWYRHPVGTLAMLAKADDLQRDGIDVSMTKGAVPPMPGMQHGAGGQPKSTPTPTASPAASGKTLYTCVMHPEVVQDHPGDCPKCGMKLVEKK